MNCDHRLIFELLRADDLSRARTEFLLDHIEDCGSCSRDIKVIALVEAAYSAPTRSLLHGRAWLLLAAGLLLALGVSSFHLFFPGTTSPFQEIATSVPYPYFRLETRASSAFSEGMTSALTAYNQSDFESAARRLKKLPATTETQFLLAVCLYMQDELDPALELFNAAAESTRWRAASLWFTANLYLRLRQPEAALDVLGRIDTLEDEYAQEAAALAETIRTILSED